jgi:hypothetical protein
VELNQNVKEAILRTVEDLIEDKWHSIEETYGDLGELAITIKTALIPFMAQTDVITEIQFQTNRRPEWKPEKVKDARRIRVNPAQRALPGQEG